MSDRISVIIPTWNRAQTLEKAVVSAMSQTVAITELLVCDDGSTDNSYTVVASLNDSRVIWLPGAHSGSPAVPRNRGIAAAKGEWIAFLDSDDEWLPDKLEKQLNEAAARSTMAVCSDAWRIRPGLTKPEQMLGGSSGSISFDDLLRVNKVICSSMMVQREILEKTSGFPEQPEMVAIEDYALWLRVADLTDIAYVAYPLLNYTDEPATSIRQKGSTVFEQRQSIMRNYIDWKEQRRTRSLNYWKVWFRMLLEKVSEAVDGKRKTCKSRIIVNS